MHHKHKPPTGNFRWAVSFYGGHAMQIVRVDTERTNRYRVFYVSEYPFADGDRFPKFLETVRFFFPDYRLNLRHIRDVDGHFVTIEEYQQRARK